MYNTGTQYTLLDSYLNEVPHTCAEQTSQFAKKIYPHLHFALEILNNTTIQVL